MSDGGGGWLREWSKPRTHQLRSAAARGRDASDEGRRKFTTTLMEAWRMSGATWAGSPLSHAGRG